MIMSVDPWTGPSDYLGYFTLYIEWPCAQRAVRLWSTYGRLLCNDPKSATFICLHRLKCSLKVQDYSKH